jgi:hypothetical protein
MVEALGSITSTTINKPKHPKTVSYSLIMSLPTLRTPALWSTSAPSKMTPLLSPQALLHFLHRHLSSSGHYFGICCQFGSWLGFLHGVYSWLSSNLFSVFAWASWYGWGNSHNQASWFQIDCDHQSWWTCTSQELSARQTRVVNKANLKDCISCKSSWLLTLQSNKYQQAYGSQETAIKENLSMLSMHRVQCCTVDAWFVFPIMSPNFH